METTHSAMYETIRKYYQNRNWILKQVRNAVVKKRITEAEFKEITGKDY